MRSLLVLLTLLFPLTTHAADWKPAKGPLLTKWGREVTPDKVLPEYPRPHLVRSAWQSLNGLWEFAPGKADVVPTFGKALSRQILVPFPVESALSGVMESHRHVVYRRVFTVPKEWTDQQILLHFGAVNWDSAVYVNGKKVTTHQGGYDPFTVDITSALKKDGEQELFVTAHNPVNAGTQPRGKQVLKPGGIYYTASTGIWQTVWLEPVPKGSVESLKFVPDVDTGKVRITVQGRGETAKGEVVLVATPPEQGNKAIKATGKVGEVIEISVGKAYLWSPETPNLYDLKVELRKDGMVIDRVESYFGMRKIEVRPDEKGITRIHLNNKPSFQVGLLDQGFWPDGLYTAPTDAALKYDIEITKKLGFNMARKHVKVEPARWYYWCDKLGLIVWQDMPSGEKSVGPGKGEIKRSAASAKQFELELSRMIDTLSHFPCIVMWVPFNEGWGQYDTKRIVEKVKKQDPTRLVNNASGWNDMKCGDVYDFHVYPGPGSPKPEPTRAAVLGEFGGLGLSTPGHMWTKEFWGYRGVRDKADLTRKYERLLQGVYKLKETPGMSAAVYTQTTDVETEANGLLTYDRAVIKVDLERVAAANRGNFSKVPQLVELVPTSQKKGLPWRYSLAKPADDWMKPTFADDAWKQGIGGFGTKGTPGGVIRTEWKTKDIWLRREFTLEKVHTGDLMLMIHHDEDAEVYINGVLAATAKGYTTDYEELLVSKEAKAALKVGKNVIAIHCKQTLGGQYIDVGLSVVK